MRVLAIVLFALAVGALATASAVAGAPSGPAYAMGEARDAAACARRCADDGLCVAWIQAADSTCALMAVVPSTAPDTGIFGMSSRAPQELRPRERVEPVQIQAAAEIVEKPVPAVIEAPLPESADTLALLGGPEEDTLRPRLGARH